MRIKTWFLNQNFNDNERYIIKCAQLGGELTVTRETEKAYLFRADSDFSTFCFWCPKSCIESELEITEKLNKGLSYNETLVSFAKENGIKGIRVGLKTATLIQKIRQAGLEVPARV